MHLSVKLIYHSYLVSKNIAQNAVVSDMYLKCAVSQCAA